MAKVQAQTQAQEIAAKYGHDGQLWSVDGVRLEVALEDAGADLQSRGRLQALGGSIRGEFERWVLGDGSAILVTPEWWDVEGSAPWVCAGAEEEGEIGLGREDARG